MLRAERAARAPAKSRKVAPPLRQPPLPAISSNKKRKLDSDDSDSQDSKKSKVRFADSDSVTVIPPPEDDEQPETSPETVIEPQPVQPATAGTVDEDEWAAFERDVASPPPATNTISAIRASATIEAAPLSAEEIAAQTRQDLSTQRGRREAELEGEKEDATRHLEEEFEEMEELEARVKRLRDRREQLRRGSATAERPQLGGPEASDTSVRQSDTAQAATSTGSNTQDEDEDEDDEDDWDDWRFRAS